MVKKKKCPRLSGVRYKFLAWMIQRRGRVRERGREPINIVT